MKTAHGAVRGATFVGAGVLLLASTLAAPAFAQDTTSPSAGCMQVVNELNDVVGQITNAQTALDVLQGLPVPTAVPTTVPTGIPSGVPDTGGVLGDATGNAADTDGAASEGDTSSAPVVEAPVANQAFVTQADPTDPVTQLQTQIAALQAQRATLASQFADLCSGLTLPDTGTASNQGTASTVPLTPYESSYPTSSDYATGDYGDTAPVYATQVGSVPSGGVDTGDGSFAP